MFMLPISAAEDAFRRLRDRGLAFRMRPPTDRTAPVLLTAGNSDVEFFFVPEPCGVTLRVSKGEWLVGEMPMVGATELAQAVAFAAACSKGAGIGESVKMGFVPVREPELAD